jgi:hypothetical protein
MSRRDSTAGIPSAGNTSSGLLPRSNPRRNRKSSRLAHLSSTPTPALHSTVSSPQTPRPFSAPSRSGLCVDLPAASGQTPLHSIGVYRHKKPALVRFRVLPPVRSQHSALWPRPTLSHRCSTRPQPHLPHKSRLNSACASEPTTGVSDVCSVAGYSPTASNKYFVDASCPVFATVITPAAINSAESTLGYRCSSLPADILARSAFAFS